MSFEDQPVYSIGAVAKMLDIAPATLRAWEERYSVVTPQRSEGSQRLYSRADVERLRYVKSQLDAGMSPADAHRLLAEELRERHLPTARRDPTSTREKPVIMIAERDPYAAQLTEYFLRTEGWEVVTALDAKQAVLHFQERAPEIVLIDVLLSGGAGFRLAGQFATEGHTQVVAVSAIDSADEAMRAGAAAFMLKPLEPLTLVSTIRDLLGTSALVRDSHVRRAPRC